MKLIITVFLVIVVYYNGVHSFESHHRRVTGKHYHVNKSKVTMPSGKSFFVITPPSSPKSKCKADLITLNAKSRKWKNEYAIVKKELENTKGVPLGTFTGFKDLKIQKVMNPCLWKKYQYRKYQVAREAKTTNERVLFHASNASYTSIERGFDERHTKLTGKYGAGLYFADNSFKSHSYTKLRKDGTRIILLCRVSLGKSHNVIDRATLAHPPVGFQSVLGRDGTFTEYIVYRGEQAYPEYLISYKST